LKAVQEFRGYIEANQNFIPNYGDCYRHGEKISTAFAESAVNQVVSKRMVKKQQMRWSDSGAHNLLQVRTKVLNDQLWETFVRWYPAMQAERETEIQKKGRVAPVLKRSPLSASFRSIATGSPVPTAEDVLGSSFKDFGSCL
jgi:hypothetical protein